MNRVVLGAASALLLAGAGFFWWQGRASLEKGAPPPDMGAQSMGEIQLPEADTHGKGAALPNVVKKLMSKEEKRFNRYDRNRDGSINRNEMLSTRVKAFQKLDVNRDNLLSFEEWAVKTANRFKEVDRNGDGIISHEELNAYYAVQDAKKAERAAQKAADCACAKAAPAAKGKRPAAVADEDED